MPVDIYEEINRYTEKLMESGFSEYAEKIQDAKLGGAMASEILGMVSVELKKAKEELGENQEFLVKKADDLLDEITNIFQGR